MATQPQLPHRNDDDIMKTMSIGICGTSINAYLRFATADDDNLDDDGVDWKSGERCKTGGARKILSQ